MNRKKWMSRLSRVLGATVILCLAVSVTWAGDELRQDAASTAEATAFADTFPVTITHRLGTVEILEPPQRIVALATSDIDTVYALGITPVAIMGSRYAPDGIYPWLVDYIDPEETEIIPATNEVNVEQILALDPDLILFTGEYGIEDAYPQLAEIAPTIASLSIPGRDSWQEQVTVIGQALGKSEEAAELIADTEAQIDEVSAELPGIVGKTFSSSFMYASGQFATLYADEDHAVQFFNELGLVIEPALKEAALGGFGTNNPGAALTYEQINLIDADYVLVAFTSLELQQEFEANPIVQLLNAIENGVYFPTLDLEFITALRFPSVLGIPYVIEQLRPSLAELSGVDLSVTPEATPEASS